MMLGDLASDCGISMGALAEHCAFDINIVAEPCRKKFGREAAVEVVGVVKDG